MKTIIDINRVSEFFFLFFGTMYIFAFLSWKNNFHPFEFELFLRLAYLPLLLFGILFAITSFRISMITQYKSEKDMVFSSKMEKKDILTLLIAFLLFGSIAFIDLFVPNINPLPLGT